MKYQTGTVLPWWIKTYIMRKKGLVCPPLYVFDGHVENDDEYKETIRRASTAGPGSRRQSMASKFVNKM